MQQFASSLLNCILSFRIPAYGILLSSLLYIGAAAYLEGWVPKCYFVSIFNDRNSDSDYDEFYNETFAPSPAPTAAPTMLEEALNSTLDNSEDDFYQECLQDGVDNSTSTIMTGLLSAMLMYGLAIHMWAIKCCYAPRRDQVFPGDVDCQGLIRPSAIWAQFLMGSALVLQSAARVFQPDANIASRNTTMGEYPWLYWSLYATSYPLMAMSLYSHGYFAMRSVDRRLRICCACFSRVGFTTGLVLTSSLLVFSAGMTCAFIDPDGEQLVDANVTTNFTEEYSDQVTIATARRSDNIFQHSSRWLEEEVEVLDFANATNSSNYTETLEIPFFEFDHACQEISYYGSYAFAISSFFFWYAASKVLRKAARRKQFKLDGSAERDELTSNMGLSTTTAITLVPWVSFFMGNLLPVWFWLASDFSERYWLDLSVNYYGGIIYHYGLSVIALLAYNWSRTLTYYKDSSVFTEEVFHDLTFGAFEDTRKDDDFDP